MRIAIVSEWFAEKMGYSENLLPKALAKLGAEVHLITSDLQPDLPNYEETYGPFLGSRIQPTGTKSLNGFTLHRLSHIKVRNGICIRGLHQLLMELRPDVVQCFTIPSCTTYQVVLSKHVLGFKLFLEEHIHRSVFVPSLKGKIYYWLFGHSLGKYISAVSERCFPIAPDVAAIVVKYFGYSKKKIEICSLGVDTDLFTPIESREQIKQRSEQRATLGFGDNDVVCIYTGRFHHGKNPLCLAHAIEILQQHTSQYKGLFVGSGTSEEIQMIKGTKGCVVHPFVESDALPNFYRAADIGVWPRQESTSQLDAAACGLPIIISDKVVLNERVEGNGLVYEEDNPQDLANKILALANPDRRRDMGKLGAGKIRDKFSWAKIAQSRLEAYESAVKR